MTIGTGMTKMTCWRHVGSYTGSFIAFETTIPDWVGKGGRIKKIAFAFLPMGYSESLWSKEEGYSIEPIMTDFNGPYEFHVTDSMLKTGDLWIRYATHIERQQILKAIQKGKARLADPENYNANSKLKD